MFYYRRLLSMATSLLILPGVIGGGWNVSTSLRVCALNGSTVTFFCTYAYPPKHTVDETFWYTGENPGRKLSKSKHFKHRVQYLGDKRNNCTLSINRLQESDSEEIYRFRLVTDRGRYSGEAVTLSLTALQVVVRPTAVAEGQKVTLTCSTTCSLTGNPTYIWYKNRERVSTWDRADKNTLTFTAVRVEDAGRYSCAVRGHEAHPSSALVLSVRYAPRNTSLSLTPPGEVLEGSSVTLSCSSDANPPAHNYTWYRETGNETLQIGSGQTYHIPSVRSKCTGHYYCLAKNDVGMNKSLSLLVDIKYAPRNTTALLSPSGTIMEGTLVTLTCNSEAIPPVHNYTWYKKTRAMFSVVGSGQNYSITRAKPVDSGQYYCKTENKVGAANSSALPLKVHKIPVVGSIVVLLAAFLIPCLIAVTVATGFMCLCKMKTLPVERGITTDSGKEASSPIYCNITAVPFSAPPTASAPAHTADTGDEGDVHYATIQFTHVKTDGGAKAQLPQDWTTEDDVEYATVNFSVLATASQSEDESVIYSNQPTLKLNTKKNGQW